MNIEPPVAAAGRRPLRPVAPSALVLTAVALLAACGTSTGSAAGSTGTGTPAGPASTAASAPATTGAPTGAALHGRSVTVDLTFSGAVSAHLSGTGPGRCDYYDIVNDQGLVYEVAGKDFGQPAVGLLQLSGVSATARPAAILNAPTASYGWYPQDGGTVKLKGDRTGASIDATLYKIAGQDKVKVSGTITCG